MDENTMDNIYIRYDEEGNDHKFELLDTCEKNGTRYYAMVPAEAEDRDDEFCEYVILKGVIVDGEEDLVSIEDDDEFDDIADYFDDLFAEEIDYDAKK